MRFNKHYDVAEVVWNWLSTRIFGLKRDEEITDWMKIHNEELNNLFSSPNIFRVIKSRRMRWTGHVARMGDRRCEYRILVGKPEGKRPLGRPRHRWEDILRWSFRKWGVGVWTGPSWLRIRTRGGHL
jgi:hypothetical protein